MTEEQKKYYNAMKKLGSKKPQKPIPRPMVPTHSTSTLKTQIQFYMIRPEMVSLVLFLFKQILNTQF